MAEMIECPRCHAVAGIPIVYGMPRFELMEAAEQGRVELGGCMVMENQPNARCRSCGHGWVYAG